MRRRPVVGADVHAGELLLRLQADEAINGWLLAGPGWIPIPRVDPLTANAQWVTTYCPDCDKHTASLRTTMPLRAHQEVVVRSSPAPDVDTVLFPYEITFDGGARYVDAGAGPEGPDRKVAGAGATLWHFPPDGGEPVQLASVVIALPASDNAQVAEATGCRAGLALLPHTSGRRAARVVGDNLAVVRYGAGTGRFRGLNLQAQMELALAPLAQRGWTLQWHAVRRRLNKAADRLATLGVFWAACLRRHGHERTSVYTVWHAHPLPDAPPQFPDSSALSLHPFSVQIAAERLEDLARGARGSARRS